AVVGSASGRGRDETRCYCPSLGGMRGGASGEKLMVWFSPCANWGSSGPPEDGSPPPVVVIVDGVISLAVASDTPPSPLPKSAVRPPCGLPSALALIAASVFSASLALYGRR